MYQITYKKRNGEVFYRYRSSLPGYIGDETSMGWIILDIKQQFKNKYYAFDEYYQKYRKRRKLIQNYIKIRRFLKNYATTLSLIILIPLYFLK